MRKREENDNKKKGHSREWEPWHTCPLSYYCGRFVIGRRRQRETFRHSTRAHSFDLNGRSFSRKKSRIIFLFFRPACRQCLRLLLLLHVNRLDLMLTYRDPLTGPAAEYRSHFRFFPIVPSYFFLYIFCQQFLHGTVACHLKTNAAASRLQFLVVFCTSKEVERDLVTSHRQIWKRIRAKWGHVPRPSAARYSIIFDETHTKRKDGLSDVKWVV